MPQSLPLSTAATIPLGPFVDAADGFTAETGLTIAQADIRLSKNGAAFAQTNNAAGATHMENGWYSVPLNTTDLNTLGRLTVSVHVAGARPVSREFMVVPAGVYAGLVSGGALTFTAGVAVTNSSANGDALSLTGNQAGYGVRVTAGSSTGSRGVSINGAGSVGTALEIIGAGAGTGINVAPGDTGTGMIFSGGSTSGHAVTFATTNGHGIVITANGSGRTGINVTGSSTGQGDAVILTGGGTGVGLRSATVSIVTMTVTTNAIAWNAAWDAEVESEANDALVANNLDHLVLSAVDTDFATTVHLNSVVGHLADNGTAATYDRTTDALEVLAAGGGGGASVDDILSAPVAGYATGTLANKINKIGTGRIVTVSGVAQGGQLNIVKGDSYMQYLGNALEWNDERAETAWPTLTGAVITLEIDDGTVVATGGITDGTSATKEVYCELSGAQTQLLAAGAYDYNVVATFPGTGTGTADDDRVTLAGTMLDPTRKCVVHDREDGN